MPLLFSLVALSAGALGAPVGDVPFGPEVPAEVSANDAFEAAKRAYLLGRVDEARQAFSALVERARTDPSVSDAQWAESWVFLGEIAWLEGDADAANADFRLALKRAPDWRPSPYDHPIDVIGAFELVRASHNAQRAVEPEPAPPKIPPLPWWGYAPFGVPQFKSGHPVRGALYATLQVGLAAASVAAWVEIDHSLKGFADLTTSEQRQARAHAATLRDAWSIPSATAFYVVWGISALDAGLAWRKEHKPGAPAAVIMLPTRDGAAVAASWRF